MDYMCTGTDGCLYVHILSWHFKNDLGQPTSGFKLSIILLVYFWEENEM